MPATAMSGSEWLLELALMTLLAATMFHAWRLERALRVLRRDRTALEELVAGFTASMTQAEGGVERLRATADGAGRQIAKHIEQARLLKEDLEFLMSRGEKLADQLDGLVRAGKRPDSIPLHSAGGSMTSPVIGNFEDSKAEHDQDARLRSQAERDLLRALKLAR